VALQDVEDHLDLKDNQVILALKVTLELLVLLVKQDSQVGQVGLDLLDALLM